MTGKSYTLVQPEHLGAIAVWKAEDGSAICFFDCRRGNGQRSVAMLHKPKLSGTVETPKPGQCQ